LKDQQTTDTAGFSQQLLAHSDTDFMLLRVLHGILWPEDEEDGKRQGWKPVIKFSANPTEECLDSPMGGKGRGSGFEPWGKNIEVALGLGEGGRDLSGMWQKHGAPRFVCGAEVAAFGFDGV
jgi:hypothetical protein